MIKNNSTTEQIYELVISTDTPWEGVDDIEIITVMADIYKNDCPFSLMEKVMDEYIETDKALVFCGSFTECEDGRTRFEKANIKADVILVG